MDRPKPDFNPRRTHQRHHRPPPLPPLRNDLYFLRHRRIPVVLRAHLLLRTQMGRKVQNQRSRVALEVEPQEVQKEYLEADPRPRRVFFFSNFSASTCTRCRMHCCT